MESHRNNYFMKIAYSYGNFRDANRISVTARSFDSPGGDVYEIVQAVLAALVAPRVDHFSFVDGACELEHDPEVNLVLTTTLTFAPISWDAVPNVEQYVGKDVCHIWEKGHQTYACLESTYDKKWFRLMSGIAMLCPWVFKNSPLTDLELEFLKMISEIGTQTFNASRFESVCKKLYSNVEEALRNMNFENMVYKLTKETLETRKKKLQNQISSNRSQIDSYQESIYSLVNSIKEDTLLLNALMNQKDESANELLEFLKSSNFHDIDVYEDDIYFTVFSYLTCYEEGEVDSYVMNCDEVLEGKRPDKNPYTKEEMRAFYKAVFIDHTLDIKLAAKYRIRSSINVYAVQVSDGDPINTDRINNPNIGYAGCLGGYASFLREAAAANDPVAALSICQQSACSVNLGEIWPMARVTRDLVSSTGDVIHTANGDITFAEAMEKIKAQMKE